MKDLREETQKDIVAHADALRAVASEVDLPLEVVLSVVQALACTLSRTGQPGGLVFRPSTICPRSMTTWAEAQEDSDVSKLFTALVAHGVARKVVGRSARGAWTAHAFRKVGECLPTRQSARPEGPQVDNSLLAAFHATKPKAKARKAK